MPRGATENFAEKRTIRGGHGQISRWPRPGVRIPNPVSRERLASRGAGPANGTGTVNTNANDRSTREHGEHCEERLAASPFRGQRASYRGNLLRQ
jgi:hypothetical protein